MRTDNKSKVNEIIVIGGGMGGLFTGALLAKEGFRVTVLEKNPSIGGGLQSFRRLGKSFDTGMHILGGFKNDGTVFKICNYLGILDKLKIKDVDHDCMDQITFLSDNRTFRVPEGKENFTAYFQGEFPEERDNIRNYVEKLFALADEMPLFRLITDKDGDLAHDEWFFKPADEFIRHFIKNPKLREVLSYMNPLCGGMAGHTPAYIFALINVLYINGQSRFAGSAKQLAEALTWVIETNSGKVICNETVSEVVIEDKVVRHVVTSRGNTYQADIYISAIHPSSFLKLTDSKLFTKAYRNRINQTENTYSAFTIYVKLKPDSLKYINHPCYVQKDYEKSWEHGEYDESDWPRTLIYLTPCSESQGEYAETMEILSLMPFSACERWAETTAESRGKDYEDWKKCQAMKMFKIMDRVIPGFENHIDGYFTSSPLTIRDFYNEPDGALYGIVKDCDKLQHGYVPIRTKAGNLLQTGQNVNLHGCCGVPITAINTAETIVGANSIVEKINRAFCNTALSD